MHNLLSERFDHRPHTVEDGHLAAPHYRQRSSFRCCCSAAYRRIDELDTAPTELGRDGPRCRRIARSAIDQYRSLSERIEHPVLAVQHCLHLDRRWQTSYDDVRVTHCFCRRRRHASFVFARKLLSLGTRSIPYHEIERITRQMRSHWPANVAETDESDFHCVVAEDLGCVALC